MRAALYMAALVASRANSVIAAYYTKLRATGKLAKTDRIDAAAIAHFAEAVRPPARPLADAEARALGEWSPGAGRSSR